ncbi:MAG: hypothetical protein RBS80_24065 [Thermoguttaceae bacterium]|nr:hypothetical protein [Thermoguttaceae bacterium]
MSLPDDETREPDDFLIPEEDNGDLPDEQLGFTGDPEAEPDFAKDPDADFSMGIEPDAEDVPVADEAEVAAAPADGIDETLEFAAPAEMESGIGFDSIAPEGDAAEEPGEGAGENILAGLGGLPEEAGEFALDEGGEELGEEDELEDESGKKPAKRAQRILAAIGGSDPYTVLMGIALLALLFGILFFVLELSAYNFDIGAERAKQLVGSLGFGWLL